MQNDRHYQCQFFDSIASSINLCIQKPFHFVQRASNNLTTRFNSPDAGRISVKKCLWEGTKRDRIAAACYARLSLRSTCQVHLLIYVQKAARVVNCRRLTDIF